MDGTLDPLTGSFTICSVVEPLGGFCAPEPCKTGVGSFTLKASCNGTGYQGASIGCYDGYLTTVGEGTCSDIRTLTRLAEVACSGRSSCSVPTPTPSLLEASCSCDGIETTAIIPGQAATVTSYAKVEGVNISTAQVRSQSFFLAEGNDTVATIIARSGDIAASLVAASDEAVRYESQWSFPVPELKPGVDYRIWSTIACVPRTNAYDTSSENNSSVLGQAYALSVPGAAAEVYQKTCSFIKFRAASAETSPQCELHAKGDANCDSSLNTDDFNTWRDEFIASRNPNVTPTALRSDFNNDGVVNTDDFNIWRDGFLNSNGG
jgi:hypothetical protein